MKTQPLINLYPYLWMCPRPLPPEEALIKLEEQWRHVPIDKALDALELLDELRKANKQS